jgi:exosortase
MRTEGAQNDLRFFWLPPVVTLAGLTLAWSVALWMLWPEWEVSPQYEYGKVVPFLSGYLFLLRWRSRPPLRAYHRERTYVSPSVSDYVRRRQAPLPVPWSSVLAAAFGVIAGLALFLHEANPEWRLLGWLVTLAATSLSLLLLHRAGGWRWVRHLGFPILLFWMAVPLPRPWEMQLMQHLMETNAALAAEVARWVGVEAVASGNVIRMETLAVGVDEACSGIRSLNGALMMGVFLGEWFALGVARRVWLVVAAALLALVTNLGRTLFLVGVAHTKGLAAMEAWHDPAGLSVLAVCLAGIAAVGWLLRSINRSPPSFTSMSEDESSRHSRRVPASVHTLMIGQGWVSAAFAVTLLGCTMGVRLWYGSGPGHDRAFAKWTVKFPREAPGYEVVPLTSTLESLLRFDHGESARWRDDKSRRWTGFYFQWDAGQNSFHDLILHDPVVCLRGLGMPLERDLGLIGTPQTDGHLTVRGYLFKDRGENVYVFNALAEEGGIPPEHSVDTGGITWRNRWQAAVQGRHSGAKRRLEVAVWGLHDDEEAKEAFQDFLRRCWHESGVTSPGSISAHP